MDLCANSATKIVIKEIKSFAIFIKMVIANSEIIVIFCMKVDTRIRNNLKTIMKINKYANFINKVDATTKKTVGLGI
jgi:uncharacterized membrane protein YqhA